MLPSKILELTKVGELFVTTMDLCFLFMLSLVSNLTTALKLWLLQSVCAYLIILGSLISWRKSILNCHRLVKYKNRHPRNWTTYWRLLSTLKFILIYIFFLLIKNKIKLEVASELVAKWHIQLHHACCETNWVAGALGKLGATQHDFRVFSSSLLL